MGCGVCGVGCGVWGVGCGVVAVGVAVRFGVWDVASGIEMTSGE